MFETEVGRGRLRVDEMIANGGAADIFRCHAPDGTELLYKEYDVETRGTLDGQRLRELVAYPQGLPSADADRLRRICAWPIATVTDDGAVTGILMRRAPDEFYSMGAKGQRLRHFSQLGVRHDDAAQKQIEYFDPPRKMAALGQLLIDLDFLHQLGVVVGDLQPKNVLTTGLGWTPHGNARVENFFLDCDSFLIHGRSAMPALDPLAYKVPPELGRNGFGPRTDLFKFARITGKCLEEDWAVEQIELRHFTEFAPSWVLGILDELLQPRPNAIGSDQLRFVGKAWHACLRKDGSLWTWNDAGYRPWSPPDRGVLPAPTGTTWGTKLAVALVLVLLVIGLVAVIIENS